MISFLYKTFLCHCSFSSLVFSCSYQHILEAYPLSQSRLVHRREEQPILAFKCRLTGSSCPHGAPLGCSYTHTHTHCCKSEVCSCVCQCSNAAVDCLGFNYFLNFLDKIKQNIFFKQILHRITWTLQIQSRNQNNNVALLLSGLQVFGKAQCLHKTYPEPSSLRGVLQSHRNAVSSSRPS